MNIFDQIAQLIIDESKWLAFSLLLAALGSVITLYQRKSATRDRKIDMTLNLLFGITIGTMAFGHLLAVTTKLWLGTLEGSIPLLYALGFSIGVPSWWLLYCEWSNSEDEVDKKKMMGLNFWTAATLMVLGTHNLPLALPGFINVARNIESEWIPKKALLWTSLLIFMFLLVGSIIFMMNGQSFEEFSGMDN